MKLSSPLLLVALLTACSSEFYDPMERQAKYKPYSENHIFLDNRSMRQPPEGTVPRERVLGSRALTAGLDDSGKLITSIPLPVDRKLLDDGRHHFDIYCAACHGLLGDGDSIVARNMSLRKPPDLHDPYIANKPIGHFYRAITEGYGLMAPYSSELNTRERWAVVAYLRALQLSQRAPLDLAPAPERERLERERKETR